MSGFFTFTLSTRQSRTRRCAIGSVGLLSQVEDPRGEILGVLRGKGQDKSHGHQVRAGELLAVEGTQLTCIPGTFGVIVLHADVFLLERIGLFRGKSGKTDALRGLLHKVAQRVGKDHGLLPVIGALLGLFTPSWSAIGIL